MQQLGDNRQHCLILRSGSPCPAGNLVQLRGQQALTCPVTGACLLQDGVGQYGSAGKAGGHRRQLNLPKREQRCLPGHTSIPGVWQ